jgi:AcrR family transcriptional regulator
MRADAKKNYDRLLDVAREVFAEHGPDASMRDIARRAEVGFATLLRHFPTREAFVEALLCGDLDALPRRAEELEASLPPEEALATWFREWMAFARSHKGVVALLASVHDNPESALYASCAAVHAASARLLLRAQEGGVAREDMNGDDMFGLMAALGWLIDLPSFAPRADHLSRIVSSAILPAREPASA